MAEQYMNEVNLKALGNESNNLQSHRGGTGEIRYVSVEIVDAAGHAATAIASGDTLLIRAAYRAEQTIARPVFQIAIVDVDTGTVITTASSTAADLPGDVRAWRHRVPVRRRRPARDSTSCACRLWTVISSHPTTWSPPDRDSP
jgi:hypothetical protein